MDTIRFVNDTVILSCKLDDGTKNLYPQAKVYHPIAGLVATVNLTHTYYGMYLGTWAGSASMGVYTVNYIVYTDSHYLTPSADYNEGAESIFIIKSLNTMYNNIELIRAIQAGRWHRVGTQMIFYAEDNITEICRFDLKDISGNPANESMNVYQRVKV